MSHVRADLQQKQSALDDKYLKEPSFMLPLYYIILKGKVHYIYGGGEIM